MSRWKHVVQEAGYGLGRNLLMTIAVILSLAVSLTLLGASRLLSRQVDLVAGEWAGEIEVSIFLCDGARCPAITPEQEADLRAQLEAEPVVETVFYESKADAFERFQRQFEDAPALVETVTADMLPASFRVKLVDPDQFAVIADRFSEFPGVEQILDQRDVLEGLLGLLDIVRDGAGTIAIIQLIAGAVLVANTIRVAAFARREQTQVMKLVGASNWYIRLPFVIEGVIEGAVGALVAVGLLWFAHPLVREQVVEQVSFVPFLPQDNVLSVGVEVLLVALAVTVVSSLLSLQRSLDV